MGNGNDVNEIFEANGRTSQREGERWRWVGMREYTLSVANDTPRAHHNTSANECMKNMTHAVISISYLLR